MRFAEGEHSGNVGDRVHLLQPLRNRHAGELVTHAEVDGQIRLHPPAIVGEEIRIHLVAVIGGIAKAALRKVVRGLIQKEQIGGVVVVLSAGTLGELLRADVLASVEAELEGMLALHPTDVVGELIKVLNRELRRVAVRTDVQIEVVENNVGELIQPRILEVTRRQRVVKPIVSEAHFVGEVRREVMIFGQRAHVVGGRRGKVEDG